MAIPQLDDGIVRSMSVAAVFEDFVSSFSEITASSFHAQFLFVSFKFLCICKSGRKDKLFGFS